MNEDGTFHLYRFAAQANGDLNGDGTVETSLTAEWVDVADAVRYDVQVWAASAAGGPFTLTGLGGVVPSESTKYTFPANTNKWYKFRVRARNAFGAPGAWTENVVVGTTVTPFASYAGVKPAKRSVAPTSPSGLTVTSLPLSNLLNWDACPDADYSYTEIWRNESASGSGASLLATVSSTSFEDSELVTGGFFPEQKFYRIRHVNRSGVASAYSSFKDGTPTQIETNQLKAGSVNGSRILNGAVDTPKMAHGAGFEHATAITASAYGNFGTGTQTIQSVTLNHGGASFVEIYGEFKNISGAARTFSVTIETPTDTIRARSCTVGPDEVVTITDNDVNPSGSSTVYRLRVQSDDSTNNVRDRYLRAVSRW